MCHESRKIQVKFKKQFTFFAISVFKKVNIDVWLNCHDLLKISDVSVWFRTSFIFECYTLGSYRVSTMENLRPFGRELLKG
jgi:hypothetical protein